MYIYSMFLTSYSIGTKIYLARKLLIQRMMKKLLMQICSQFLNMYTFVSTYMYIFIQGEVLIDDLFKRLKLAYQPTGFSAKSAKKGAKEKAKNQAKTSTSVKEIPFYG